MRIASAGLSDVGRKRERNEDSFLIDEALQLFVVADGMGGHQGGQTASRLAIETIERELKRSRQAEGATNSFRSPLSPSSLDHPLPELLRGAVENASAEIYRAAQSNADLSGMGTTVTALLVHEHRRFAYFAHVGDSRAYLIRGSRLQQISQDHSLVGEQIRAGILTADQAKQSRVKNIITRSVGFEDKVEVDVMGLEVEAGDTFLLCSDGLINFVEDREIFAAVREGRELVAIPAKLIALANERGGDDNITVVVVRIERQ